MLFPFLIVIVLPSLRYNKTITLCSEQ
jgi:hypothetical protein